MRRLLPLLSLWVLLAAKPAVRAPIETLEWSADGTTVIAAGKLGPVFALDGKGKGKAVAEGLGQPRPSADGRWVVGTREGAFVAVEVSSGDQQPVSGVPNRGKPVRYLRSPHGDVVLLKDSVHYEIHRVGNAVLDDRPLGLKNYLDLWVDPRDPLLYLDTGYGLEVYHLWTGVRLRTFVNGSGEQRYPDAVRDPDGRVVLLLSDADGSRVWMPPDPPGSRLDVPEGGVVALCGDGSWVAVGGPDGVRILASANQQELLSFPTKEAVVAIAVAGDGAHVAAGLADGSVKVFDTRKASAPSPTDRPILPTDTGRIGAEVLRLPLAPRKLPDRSTTSSGTTDGLRYTPSGRVAGWIGGRFVEVDADGRRLEPAVPFLAGTPFAYADDGTVIAGVTATGLALVDTRNPKKWKVTRQIASGGGHRQLQWHGGTLVVDAGSGRAQAWDPVQGAPFGEAYAAGSSATARIALSPDGAMVAVTGRTPALLDSRSGQRLTDLGGQVGGAVAAAWSPDGKRLATSGADGTLLVWELATLSPLRMVDGAFGTHLAFSPDGARVLSASSDGGVVVDVEEGAVVERLPFDGQLEAVAWSAAGRLMADNAGNVFFWGP